jgi:Pectate lyase superfamily protein
MTACVGQVFDAYHFLAAGSTAKRTLPDRLSEVVNVRDWGAVGDGSTIDTAAIQAAIDFCISKGGGKVYFPAGNYKVGSLAVGHASINTGVQLVGAGQQAVLLSGGSSGFTVSSGGRANDCLELVSDMFVINSQGVSGSGAIQLTRTKAVCTNLSVQGYNGIDASNCTGAYISSIIGSGTSSNGANASSSTHGFYPFDAIGIQVWDGGTIFDCRMQAGFGIAFLTTGHGANCIACASEVNTLGARLGSATTKALGCSLIGLDCEQINVSAELYDCEGCYVSGLFSQGSSVIPAYVAVSAVTWAAGVVTITSNGHNIPSSPNPIALTIFMSNGNWYPPASANFIPVTVTDANHFTYALAADPGSFSGSTGTLTWNAGSHVVTVPITTTVALPVGTTVALTGLDASWGGSSPFNVTVLSSVAGSPGNFTYAGPTSAPSGVSSGTWMIWGTGWTFPRQYLVRLRKAHECLISNGVGSGVAAQASVDLDYGYCMGPSGYISDAANAELRNVVFENVHAANGWAPPVTKHNSAGCKFIHCSGVINAPNSPIATVAQPVLTFADLPGQTGVFQPGPLEGQVYSISNGNNATFGGTQAGGGSGHYLVRYDGSNWVRIG